MAEKLCHDCNLGSMGEVWLEAIQIDVSDTQDQELIAEQPNADELQAALELPRPWRCQALRKILPTPPPKGPNHNPYARCPEIGLLGFLYKDLPIELTETD